MLLKLSSPSIRKVRLKLRGNSSRSYNNNCGFNNNNRSYERRDERGNERRRRDSPNDREDNYRPPKRSRNSKYESNVTNQFEYILISALCSSSPLDSWDSWMVDSGASHHFSGYKEVVSNLVERETNLNIILGDNTPHLIKGFGSVKFHLNFGESVLLHDVMYVRD